MSIQNSHELVEKTAWQDRFLGLARKLGKIFVSPQDNESSSDQNDSRDINSLAPKNAMANWKLPPSRQPHLMVHDMGPHLDEIAQNLIDRVAEPKHANLSIGFASEMGCEANRFRPLRFVHQFQTGHVSTTDVTITSEAQDLYVSFTSRPQTLLAYLNFGLRAVTIAMATLLLLWIYLHVSGARASWIKDYADKHSSLIYNDSMGSDFLAKRMMNGGYTIHWGAMINAIANDEGLYGDYQSIIASVRQESRANMRNSADFAGMAQLESVELLASYGLDCYQKVTGDWLRDNLGDQYFIWWDTNRPLYRDLRSSGSFSQMAVKAFGIQTLKDPDGEFTWTSLEVNDIGGLRQLWVVGAEGNRDPFARLFDDYVVYHEPWSLFQLVKNDPRTALFNIGMPATMFVGLIGFLVWRAPKTWLRYPCRLLGWITPEDFNSQAIARNAWIERQFSKSLADFGVGRAQITELNGVSHAN